ncbi:MAG: nicotinate (nicotinamide) nucleotide adenylyltransferase [Spirochaetaceae bacterium 4572_59]|nr:MAG: nicotinate (nicotinamide) nucleotide adenylyltransferase [Spirochaetaceae bacterium 4572_59]
MKLVMLGGTFNPPHNGHIAMADLVRRNCSYDQVVLIPSFQPPHKTVFSDVNIHQRLAMTELAAKEIENAFVSDCEMIREGVSYSLDTVRYLKEKYSLDGKPGLIIGDDLIPGFSSWHSVDMLVEEVDLIVLHRGDSEKLDLPYPHSYLSNPIISLSSSEIRSKVEKGLSIDADVPGSIVSYIRSEGLYGR